MKSLKILSVFAAFILILNACTERIDIKLDDTYTRLVVEGAISTDTTRHIVKLTKTSSYFANEEPPAVSGAIVKISDGTQEWTLTENPQKPGVYETSPLVYGVPGKTYTLTIRNVDIDNNGQTEEYTASSLLQPINSIDSIRTEYRTDYDAWEIKLYTYDSPMEDHYLFNLYKNNILQTDTITEPLIVNDKLFNGNYTNGIGVAWLRDEKTGEKGNVGDHVLLEIWGITKDYYNFISDIGQETSGSNPMFSGPPANIRGNVNNGAFGFFAAYSISRASGVLK